MNEAEKLSKLFDGQDIAYGTYKIDESEDYESGEKVGGKATTVFGEVNLELWQKHIAGEGIGIIPCKADSTCRFGAIDIDLYKGIDYQSYIDKLAMFKLPLLPVKSKSGGLHLFLFTSEPVKASKMQEKLREFASSMGIAFDAKGKATEIFPKQKKSDSKNLGNWINMPYCNGTRLGLDDMGEEIPTLEAWLELAYSKRVSSKEFDALATQCVRLANGGAPPCAEIMASQGMASGQRNESLFHFGILAKRYQPNAWQKQLEDWNQEFLPEPLPAKEVANIIGSLEKKDYIYACDKDPMRSFCNRQLCQTRLYGVNQDTALLDIKSIFKIGSTPPMFVIHIADVQIRVTAEELYSQSKFAVAYVAKLNQFPQKMRQEFWTKFWNEQLKNVVNVELPYEYTVEGSLTERLKEFTAPRRIADDVQALNTGRPYKNLDGYILFKIDTFFNFLENKKWRELGHNEILGFLKNNVHISLDHREVLPDGTRIRCISMSPDFFEGHTRIVSDVLDLDKIL